MGIAAWKSETKDAKHLSSHPAQHSATVAGGSTHLAECGVGTLAGQDVVLNLISSDVKANELHLLGLVIGGQWPAQPGAS